MARATFGGSVADYVVAAGSDGLLRLASASLTMWTAATGGTKYTDLLLNGSPATSIPVGADGAVPAFQGPDGVTELWADAGHGRVRLTAPVTVVDSAVAALASNPASATGTALTATIGGGLTDQSTDMGVNLTTLGTSYTPRTSSKRVPVRWFDNMTAGWTTWGTSTHGDLAQTVHVSSAFGTIAQYVSHGAFSYGGIEKWGFGLDLTKYDLVVRFLLPDMSKTSKISVWVGNPEANNYYSGVVAGALTDPVRGIVAGVPQTVILPLEAMTVVGTAPSPSNLDRIRFAVDTINDGNDATFQFLGIGLVPKQDKAKIAFTFDDSGMDLWSYVFPAMRSRGLRGTAFIDAASATQSGRPTTANYQSMYACGWEIAAHTWGGSSQGHNNYEQQTHAWRMWRLAQIKKFHLDNGIPTDVFAWPNGHADAASIRDVSRFFAIARGTNDQSQVEGAMPGNPYSIRTFVAGSSRPLSDYTDAIDRAIAGRYTQVFTFHSVTPDASESTLYITQALFTQIVDYLKAKVDAGLVDVVNMAEAFLVGTGQKRSQTDVFKSSGTWHKPDWASRITVTCVGAGGGGGSGYRGAAGAARGGGGGGGGGSTSTVEFAGSDLPAAVTVSVGTGGAGGTGSTTDNAAGGAGVSGGSSTFGANTDAWYVEAGRGTAGGNGGSAAAGAAGGVGNGGVFTGSNGGAGSSGSAVGASGGSTGNGAAGGGGGGGLSTANALSAAGAGGKNLSNPGVSAAAGATDGSTGGAGYGRAGTSPSTGASGGGGGAASVAGAGGAGGAGGWPGGGGGGGGASVNGQTSGAGGAGADGVVVVTSYP